jgi:hypothetical protein
LASLSRRWAKDPVANVCSVKNIFFGNYIKHSKLGRCLIPTSRAGGTEIKIPKQQQLI